MLQAALQTVVGLIYPPRCLTCGGMVESDFGLCGACWRETPFISGLGCDLCGTPLPGHSDGVEHCDDCMAIARPWRQGRATLVYRDRGRKLVLMMKHGDRHDIAEAAGIWMAARVRPILRGDPIVVPIPLHIRRHLKRRFNQSDLLAQSLARRLGVEHWPDALQRFRHTPSLGGKGLEDRFKTVADTIRITPARSQAIKGRNVLLVDDVMTSGATLTAAADACLAGGAESVCISVLARVAKDT